MARNTGYWYHRFPWSRANRFLAIIFDFAAWEDLEINQLQIFRVPNSPGGGNNLSWAFHFNHIL
jgi:hypothetical protein